MFKKPLGALVFSPSDLIRFMESPFASWMDRYNLEFPRQLKPDDDSEEVTLIKATGDKHEHKFLEKLKKDGRKIFEIDRRSKNPEADTLAAMEAGHEVIFQACLSLEPFRGYADFLVRVESANPTPQYEIWDTKLARKTKPYYLVQLCCYAEMLEQIQGTRPSTVRIVLGNNEIPAFKTEDFIYYYRQLKKAFLDEMKGFDAKNPPVPDARADHSRWQSYADRKLREMDHLSRVARITTGQIKRLNEAGITTVAQLARAKHTKKLRLSLPVIERLIEQAQLQVATEELRAEARPDEIIAPLFRVIPIDPAQPRQGLSLLPPHSPGDLFFDMEGFPLVDGGLEYLFGVSHRGESGLEFADWWAHDAREEKTAFEGFIDWAYAKWTRDPTLHIYHYAQYEVSALRRLMGRHGTREDRFDAMLRQGVFIDLYKVTQQGLRIGESSYSIKAVEHLYRGKRAGDVKDAGQSIVYYANWIESGEPREWKRSPILQKIRDYNRDDCDSTLQLCAWLREEQRKAGIAFIPNPTDTPPAESNPDQEAHARERTSLIAGLRKKFQTEKDSDRKKIHEMLLNLVEFHRRESKPVWWRMFDRAEQDSAALEEDLACIGGAKLSPNPPVQEKRSLVFTYRFNPDQDTKVAVGERVHAVPNLTATMEVVSMDAEAGEVQVKLSQTVLSSQFGGVAPARTSFIPYEFISPKPMADSIQRLALYWNENGLIPDAFRRLLFRSPPKLAGANQMLRRKGEDVVDAAIRCTASMRGSVLCIQGPPGTGKSFTAARCILSVLKAGKNVGITSNSHKAIQNLLRECHALSGGTFKGLYVTNNPPEDLDKNFPGIETSGSSEARGKYRGGLIAGTAWLFSRPEWAGELKHLFIDEAGQVSLANIAAMCAATDNMVLLGDQMQLEQPIQGTHPGESGQSALDYYLDGNATIPETLGLFLSETRRLHPEICQFVSSLVYDGRLVSAPGNENRQIQPAKTSAHVQSPSGILFSPVEHDGNTQSSLEELNRIKVIVNELVGRPRFGTDGKRDGCIKLDDILFVAPYNMQVRLLRAELPVGARVGSVDKFQGQEADVVILSMCSSFGEYGSRGLEFILDQNRMNVAVSRARILAFVVGDPRIAATPARSVDAMRQINLYCRLIQGSSVN